MSPHAITESVDGERSARSERMDYGKSSPSIKSPLNQDASVKSPQSLLQASSAEETYDLICVGFGPASLAIAIALHDALDSRSSLPGLNNIRQHAPKILFVEKQFQFGWHTGMLLPGARMQISFVKDLATLRNPRSEFTFLNYLYCHDRIAKFTNLDTFLPHRIEYEDYMKWCSRTFDDVVQYGREVTGVSPEGKRTTRFCVEMKNTASGSVERVTAKNVVLATGGQPQIPAPFPQNTMRVLHSSRYANNIGSILQDKDHTYEVAVVGCGQSAAEIFNDLHSRYPNAKTRLIIRGAALKPTDDSPL